MKKYSHRFLIFFILITSAFCRTSNLYGQIVINEFLASNSSVNEDPDFHENSDWLELYNAGNIAVNLKGYYITDNLNNPAKWRITIDTLVAPHAFVVIWTDGRDTGLHTSYKLAQIGEEIGIYSPTGNLLDFLIYSGQNTDISIGSFPDGSSERFYFNEPTPGSANNTQPYIDVAQSFPEFSVTGGLYNAPVTVELSTYMGGTIRYTLDGSEPSEDDPEFSNPIEVNATTVIRARIFKPDQIPGPVITHTYFLNEHFQTGNLPVISIASNPENFWDTLTGIYMQDFKPEWEVPINIELFENNGSDRAAFSERAGTKINGLHAWQLPQKMLGIYFRKRYGSGKLEYPLFFDRERNSFKTFALRASGSDWSYTLFRDGMIQNSTKLNMELDNQGFRPCVVYINGEYMGIHNMREKVDEDLIAKSHHLEEGTFDMIENENYAEAGDLIEYDQFLNLYAKDLSVQPNYDLVAEKMDIEGFTDFICTHIASRNTSINHNMMAWKPKETGRWKWILADLDRGFFSPTSTLISYYTGQTVIPFRELMQNQGYKDYFGKRLADHLFTTFNPIRIKKLIDNHQQLIEDEMPYHIERWLGATSSYGNAMPSLTYWYNEVNKLKTFADARPGVLLNNLTSYGFGGNAQLNLKVSPANAGALTFNGMKIPESEWSGYYLKDVQIELVAEEKPGYRFKGWTQSNISDTYNIISVNRTYHFSLSDNYSLTALYESDGSCILPPIIGEDMILNKGCSPYLAQGDITIKPGVTLSIDPGVEIQMPPGANIFVNGAIAAIGKVNERIIFRLNPKYNDESWGALCFLNTPDTSHFSFVTIEDASKGPIPGRDGAAISAFKANLVLDNLIIEDVDYNPVIARYSDIMLKNSSLHSKVTGDLINVKYGKARIENCIFRGNDQPDTDAVDYDDVVDGIIRKSKIYNFFGFNSDAIDIGEKARNIIIDSMLIFNITDKGVSVGQQSSVRINHCTFVNCNLGLGLKDSCHVTVDHCTFYSNNFAVSCFEKNAGSAGGNAIISNSILSNSYERPYFFDNLSSFDISNSLSDTETIPGNSFNKFGNPLFTNPNRFDFSLLPGSPCIQTGSDNGIQSDMGTHHRKFLEEPHLMINGIFYNPLNRTDQAEYLSVLNPSGNILDISGYRISKGVEFEFPHGTILYPGENFILVKDLFSTTWQYHTGQIRQWNSGNLSNQGEKIQLMDNHGIVIDQVKYMPQPPWPPASYNLGEVLVLKSADLDNHFPESWTTARYTGIEENTIPVTESLTIYPNPASGYIFVSSEGFSTCVLEIYDLFGTLQQKIPLIDEPVQKVDLTGFASGSYIIRCGEFAVKVVLIR